MLSVTDCVAEDGIASRLCLVLLAIAADASITGSPNKRHPITMSGKLFKLKFMKSKGKRLTSILEESCTAPATGRGKEQLPSELPPL